MNETDSLKFLNNLQRFGWRFGLDNILRLLHGLGNPQTEFSSIHIAGTNGKGSTAAILESIYRHAGYKTGLFTSPHLVNINERIQINASPIPMGILISYVSKFREDIEEIGCTYFEVLTALAFRYFADSDIDVALVEVGLGGRLDATNIISPVLSVITQIDLDHTEHLGKTLTEIGTEKAQIIKSKVPCLSQSGNPEVSAVISRHASERNSQFYTLREMCSVQTNRCSEDFSEFSLTFADEKFEDLKLELPGRYQINNAALAVAATKILVEQFSLQKEVIYSGLRNVKWPGRLQKLQDGPKVVVDVAHNTAAVKAVIEDLKSIYQFDRLIVLAGLLDDKNFPEISKIIASAAETIFVVTPTSERALDGKCLCEEFLRYSVQAVNCPDTETGFQKSINYANETDLICVLGSHYVVGELLHFYKKP